MKIIFLIVLLIAHIQFSCIAQKTVFNKNRKDTGIFIGHRSGYISKCDVYKQKNQTNDTTGIPPLFKLSTSKILFPDSLIYYKTLQHFKPSWQGNTLTDWCFSAVSFIESEIMRIHKKKIKLSEMYVVYNEYIEKTREFVDKRGNICFEQNSNAANILLSCQKYGILPYETYKGNRNNTEYYCHQQMFKEMANYLNSVKTTNNWDEETVVETVRAILEHYMGKPPTEFTWSINGIKYSPKSFWSAVVKLEASDYIELVSDISYSFNKKIPYSGKEIWRSHHFAYNIDLTLFSVAIKNALSKGFTVCVTGNLSGAGFDPGKHIAVIPTFDIPFEYIDNNARQFRIINYKTRSKHSLHIVGHLKSEGEYWFLLKDSDALARMGKETDEAFGYLFMHEDFIKLNILNCVVNKNAVKDVLRRIK